MKGEYGGFGEMGWYHFVGGVVCLYIAMEMKSRACIMGGPSSHAAIAIRRWDGNVLDGMRLCL